MFKCSGCGSCCKHIDIAVKNFEGLLDFPYFFDESGKCEKLSIDNKCTVYNNRPLMCDVDRFAEHFLLDKESFYEINRKACNDLMGSDKVDLSYRL